MAAAPPPKGVMPRSISIVSPMEGQPFPINTDVHFDCWAIFADPGDHVAGFLYELTAGGPVYIDWNPGIPNGMGGYRVTFQLPTAGQYLMMASLHDVVHFQWDVDTVRVLAN